MESSDCCLFSIHSQLQALGEHKNPWPRLIITPLLPNVKMLMLFWWKADPNSFGSLLSSQSGYAAAIMEFFCSFTHLRIPRSPPKFNQFFVVLPGVELNWYPLEYLTSQQGPRNRIILEVQYMISKELSVRMEYALPFPLLVSLSYIRHTWLAVFLVLCPHIEICSKRKSVFSLSLQLKKWSPSI